MIDAAPGSGSEPTALSMEKFPTRTIRIINDKDTTGFNFAFAISAWHTLVVNTTLLPKALRPNWLIRIGLVLSGLFFVCLGIMSVLKMTGMIK